MTTTSTTALKMTTLDCADPRAEATFWSELLGWQVAAAEDEYAMVVPPDGGPALGFGRVEGYETPGWPNEHGTKQFHLDLAVEDIDRAEPAILALGARVADDQPSETGSFRVYLDPAGHPFCLCRQG